MFTGIIEGQGIIRKISSNGNNKLFWIRSDFASKLKIDQSICHDGVCLTVEEIKGRQHKVTAISETLSKTTLGEWQVGHPVNLERCLKMNSRLDGHFVQGHVDTTSVCVEKTENGGSWEFTFSFPERFASLIIEKGSLTINGISLTVFNVSKNSFQVAIIPYTFENTNISTVEPGIRVNLEFDLIGKYIDRKLSLRKE